MSSPKFTLNEVQWFNRNVPVEALIKGLVARGVIEEDQEVFYIATTQIQFDRLGGFNILQFYQDYITSKEFTQAIDDVVLEYVEQYRNDFKPEDETLMSM